jgi:hypothetical protein
MPKNIVLLSDGTGNSAAQLLKTNVWRVYEALQLTDPTKQVACYDDGVGTSSFKPLALLGGAFGVGLARNVLRLYRFLCEHYQPGDRIYAFGFSRGAFTIRVLIGLICDQGIIKTHPPVAGRVSPTAGTPGTPSATPPDVSDAVFGSDLARLSRWAYREFRKKFNQTGWLVTIARALRDVVLRGLQRGHEPYHKRRNYVVDSVEFVGVWDTVDAYGLPIDELTDGVDRWVWPLSMPELKLSPKVRKGCHVLALDDERNTFHPVLWDEEDESQTETDIKHERISQVWFSGMHSNVGGGYPDDALSCVSLSWMTRQAEKRELLFWPELITHYIAKADPLGRIYDSRSGLKGYYRYNPRKIEWLTNGQVHEKGFFNRRWPNPSPTVTIRRPKIHQSVFDRIRAAPEAYAPIVFPERYAVVTEAGEILDGADHPFETELGRQARSRKQEAAWNLVWLKRFVYFLTVGVSLVLALLPFIGDAPTTAERGPISRVILSLGQFLPSFAAPWVRYYAAEPWTFVAGAGILALLMYFGRRLQARICQKMRAIWLQMTSAPPDILQSVTAPTDWKYRVRSHHVYQGMFSVLRRKLLPAVFGITMLLWLAGAVNRIVFEGVGAAGQICRGSEETGGELLRLYAVSRPIVLPSNELCAATGVRLAAGARYRIHLQKPDSVAWRDLNIDGRFPGGFTAASPGLSLWQRALLAVSTPFRRQWSGHWFVPVARVGSKGIEYHHLPSKTNEVTPLTSGELFLFVNDAIAPLGLAPPALGWHAYYKNNKGRAIVTVTKIADAPSRSAR